MPDSDKAPGQAVKQEPADELNGGNRDLFGAIFLAVFNREGHPAVFKLFNATVGNRHAVGVACQVFQNVIGAFDRISHGDDPVFFIQSGFKLLVLIAGKLEILPPAASFHMLHELSAKNQRQRLLVKEIVALYGPPG